MQCFINNNGSNTSLIHSLFSFISIIEVDPTVQLLARIADSVDVKNFLKFHKRDRKSSKDTNTAKSSSDTNLSADVNAARPRHTSSSSHKESDENEPANRVAAKSFKRDLVKHKHDQRLDFTFLSYDFSPFDGFPDVQIPSLANMSITEQQNALINDLLYVLVVSILFVDVFHRTDEKLAQFLRRVSMADTFAEQLLLTSE